MPNVSLLLSYAHSLPIKLDGKLPKQTSLRHRHKPNAASLITGAQLILINEESRGSGSSCSV